jgi:hypothetical protein
VRIEEKKRESSKEWEINRYTEREKKRKKEKDRGVVRDVR